VSGCGEAEDHLQRRVRQSKGMNFPESVSLTYFALHTPFLFFALASPRELSIYAATIGTRLWWGLVLAGLAVPVVTGLVARRLTRRTFGRFDEWVGRPIAGGRSVDEGIRGGLSWASYITNLRMARDNGRVRLLLPSGIRPPHLRIV
jgi:hypothetical protein